VVRALAMAAKCVGGMCAKPEIHGTSRVGFKPVEPALQRKALQMPSEQTLAAHSLRCRPERPASLTADGVDFKRASISVPQTALASQTGCRPVAGRLQGGCRPLAGRLLDAGVARDVRTMPVSVMSRY